MEEMIARLRELEQANERMAKDYERQLKAFSEYACELRALALDLYVWGDSDKVGVELGFLGFREHYKERHRLRKRMKKLGIVV